MLWIVTEKVVLKNVYNWKFLISSVLIIILMILNAIFFSLEIEERFKEYGRLKEEGEQRNNLEEAYAFRVPSPLIFLAEGGEQYLPGFVKIVPGSVDSSSVPTNVKSLLIGFEHIDWVYIIGALASLICLFFTHDAISGDKESGTLRLMLSNPLSRSELIIGSYLGSIISLMLPLGIGILINLSVISLLRGEILLGDNLARIAIVAILSMLYVSLFILAGIFSSCLFQKTSTSLIITLLLWVLLVIVIPQSSGVLARIWKPIPTYKEVQEKIFNIRLTHGRGTTSTDMIASIVKKPISREMKESSIRKLEEEMEEMYIERKEKMQEMINDVLEGYARKREEQTIFARMMARISPMAIYQYAVEELANSGYARHRSFLQSARSYMMRYTKYARKLQREKKKQALPTSYGIIEHEGFRLSVIYSRSYKYIPIDPSSFPRFEDKRPAILDSLVNALWDIAALFLINVVFFLGSILKFYHYDVR